MYKDDELITVRNRNVGSTGYTLDSGIHRHFEYNEVKKVPFGELKSLSYSYGGRGILQDCLVIEDKNALEFLNLNVEPEYFYSDSEIKEILLNGSLDQLEDTLNFAPDGILEMIKKMAVDLEIPDTRKRDMISKRTGFNINNAIMVNKIMAEGQPEETKTETPKRKTVPLNAESETTVRKAPTPAPKYKIIEKK